MRNKISFTFFLLLSLGLLTALNMKIIPSAPPPGRILNSFNGLLANNQCKVDNCKYKEIKYMTIAADLEVLFDGNYVPHIYSANLNDLFFAQGYIHASMRLWQMDIQTRSAAGRLSEVLGEITFETDRLTRRQGLAEGAKLMVEKWKENEEVYSYIASYCEGINKYISELKKATLPWEYKLMEFEPEHWTPLHCALMLKNMARTLCMSDFDIEMTNVKSLLPDSVLQELFSVWEEGASPVIPVSTSWHHIRKKKELSAEEDMGLIINDYKPYENLPPGAGSNNWAVGPAKTRNGHAILCSDPHLNLTMPSIWYENHLVSKDMDVYGVSLPGLPGVIIGFNENIAWAQTNVGHDVLDWYAIDWIDEKNGIYVLDGKETGAEIRVDTHYIKGHITMYDTVMVTPFGPVVYNTETNSGKKGMAMTWIANLKPQDNDIACIVDLNRASNYLEFSEALLKYDTPAQNFVYADVEGNIGMHVQGRLPDRPLERGRYVQSGNTSKNRMNNFVPSEDNPKVKNPPRGYVSSANQVSTDESYPYPYNGFFAYYRAVRLNKSLDTMRQVSVQDMKDLQFSNYSLLPEKFLEIALPVLETGELTVTEKQWLEKLTQWNRSFDPELQEPVLFEYYWHLFYENLWDEFENTEQQRFRRPTSASTVLFMKNNPSSPFFDDKRTPETESMEILLMNSFKKAVADLEDKIRENPAFNWHLHKPVTINHLGRIPAFSEENVYTGGHREALNANNSPWGPSWRMVVEMSKPVKAYGIYPGGQSGDPGSIFYNDRIKTWANGKYNLLHFPAPLEKPGFEPVQIWKFIKI